MDWRESRAGKRWLAVNKVQRIVWTEHDGTPCDPPDIEYSPHPRKQRVKMTWLARARLLSGQSVAQAAKSCGLSPRTWEAWERVGKTWRRPDPQSTYALVQRYPILSLHGLVESPCAVVNPATLEVVP